MENQEKKNLHEQIERLICIKKEELYELKMISRLLMKAAEHYNSFEEFKEAFPNLQELIELDNKIRRILNWGN